MSITQEYCAWKASRFRVARVFALGLVLAAASCSKEEKPAKEPAPKAAVRSSHVPAEAAAPAAVSPVAKTTPPVVVVTPGHIPPNPRVSQVISETGDAPLEALAPAAQPEPAPTVPMYTPAQANQARLRALEEMYRLRGQPPKAPDQPQTQPGGGPDSRPVEKAAPTKNQP